MDQTLIPTLSLDEANFERAISFLGIYDLQVEIGFEKKKTFLGTKTPRICRFCHKTDKEVKFSNDAHVLPQFTGNRYLMSFFECNECNDRFSLYEDSLSKYIGITRTIHQIKGKSATKVPKFKDPKTGLQLLFDDVNQKLILIQEDGDVVIDEQNKKLIIRTTRNSYIPIHIPKTLLKIAFCLLSEDELESYDRLRRLLILPEANHAVTNNPLFHIYGYFIPGTTYFKKPSALLYSKKPDQQSFLSPQKQLVFQYANYVLQIPLIGDQDQWLSGQSMQLPLYPLMVDAAYFERYGTYQMLDLNLTSPEKKRDDSHVITFNIDTVIRPGQDEK